MHMTGTTYDIPSRLCVFYSHRNYIVKDHKRKIYSIQPQTPREPPMTWLAGYYLISYLGPKTKQSTFIEFRRCCTISKTEFFILNSTQFQFVWLNRFIVYLWSTTAFEFFHHHPRSQS